MNKKIGALLCLLLSLSQSSAGQTFYVDPQRGDNNNSGNLQAPFLTLAHAVTVANNLTGQGSIVIKLMPGIHLLTDKIVINPVRVLSDTSRFALEAQILPGDSLWSHASLPVLQSVAPNNSITQFRHATGLLVGASHVTIRGLKFTGTANPEVMYYYPITRENPELKDLEVAQCYFVGEKNSTLIQGGIWAHGPKINIQHCVFYGCRNGILVFENIAGCSITNNIIYGAYESALWVGENHNDFLFSNNVISNCLYVWVNSNTGPQTYKLSNSVFADNQHFLGKWNNEKYDVVDYAPNSFKEENIIRNGPVILVERQKPEEQQPLLHLAPKSAGLHLGAGVIKK